jgi:exonuclease III
LVMKLTLLSWNVAGKVRRAGEQAAMIASLGPDVICLQEVRPSAAQAWTSALQGAGWMHVAIAPPDAGRERPLSVLTAARRPFTTETIPNLPWPERALSAHIDELELVNLHSPISPSPGLAKVLTHEAVHAHLAHGTGPRVLCGDLNTPRKEHPDGRVWTFARTRAGQLRPERCERWDEAELALIKGLERFGFRDGFRTVHGLQMRELSWEWPRSGGGYRLDHLIASQEVSVVGISYVHEWRKAGLSDHSPLLAALHIP